MKKIAIISVLAAGVSTLAVAQEFTATFNLIQPVDIAETTQLDFGNVKLGNNITCTLAPADGAASGDACLSSSGTAGVFTISGDANRNVAVTLNDGSGSGVTFAPAASQSFDSAVALDGDGKLVFNLGGTLTVSDTASAGAGSVTYTIDVAYQ
ncbi:DUF4402 domain-containing protein [Ferrimonas sp. YFM]|uniref:DUF4402 domain-containing protein n=1 Tax=Ferrimonas sp. YFM TaxID=3028878 RepID=UPI002573E714|nr:DUF4402 domain-containing protein [Ferrimonas sp. YFM]BDY06341.1 hypothetical protein F0521_33820 [Ferrimonas sp. YFM]